MQGVKDQFTLATGIATWGMMTGVSMVQAGFSVPEATLMTLLVYAGSAQLTATPLMLSGAPLWVILAAAFCVNLRFVVFSAHMRPYMLHLPLKERLISGYVTGDLSYVLFVKKYPQPGQSDEARAQQQAYLMGNCAINYSLWMVASLIGVAMAKSIPVAWGMGFAGVLALVGVGMSLASTRLRVLAAGVDGAAAVAAWALPLKLNIIVAVACAVLMALLIEQVGPRWLKGHDVPGGSHG